MKGVRIGSCGTPSLDGGGSKELLIESHADIDEPHPLLLDERGFSPEATVIDIEVVEG